MLWQVPLYVPHACDKINGCTCSVAIVVVKDVAAAVVLCLPYTATEDLLAVEQELGEFSKWEDLGLNLGLSADSLEIIEEDQRLTKGRVRAVLLKWLRKEYNVDKHGPPSWKALADSIRPVNRALSTKIKDKHS